jgi:predicted phage terminase large subunit-like protein
MDEQAVEEASTDLLKFTDYTFKKFSPTTFHSTYYSILDRFLKKGIKNLIISVPPQHGKSEGSSRRLPAAICGTHPDDKVALVCYSSTKAQKFGREIMGVMREKEYVKIFPNVEYPERGYTGAKANTNENRESINSDGSMKFVGVDGGLTGDPVDVLIMDDLYKNWEEANSPVTSQKVWDWYLSVADTRLHNDSQQLIVFTRWSENDLIGRLEEQDLVKTLEAGQELDELIDSLKPDEWLKVNFQALKEDEKTQIDEREEGEPLWEDRHNKQKLESSRKKDTVKFSCLYQGNPKSREGLLYGDGFKTYSSLPSGQRENYTDTADTGRDFLCSISYVVNGGYAYVIDVVYDDRKNEITEPIVTKSLWENNVNTSHIESNNGGRSFSRNIERLSRELGNGRLQVKPFHQSKNKVARILSNSSNVIKHILMPEGWESKHKKFHKDVTGYLAKGINAHDDAPDTLTGIYEKMQKGKRRIF